MNKKQLIRMAMRMSVVLTVLLANGLNGFSQITKQGLDSIVTPNSGKRMFTYDSKGNVASAVYADWNYDDNVWEKQDSTECKYDAAGNQILQVYYLWDTTDWKKDYKSESNYDAAGNQTLVIGYWWNDTGWVKSYKNEMTYDADGNEATQTAYQWENNDWKKNNRKEWTYNADGNLIVEATSSWDNNSWKNFSKYEYDYDGDGNRMSKTEFLWNNTVWTNTNHVEYAYDAAGNCISSIYAYWLNNAWKDNSRVLATYDTDGNQTSEISESWTNNAWVGTYRDDWTYANGNMTTHTISYWINNDWGAGFKYELTYNLAFADDDLICPTDYRTHNMHVETSSYSWDLTENDWTATPVSVTSFYWSAKDIDNTGIEQLTMDNGQWTIYPNPTKGKLTIVSDNAGTMPVQIYDIYGREIINSPLSIVNSIDISHLSNGLYFLKMGNKTVKIIKE